MYSCSNTKNIYFISAFLRIFRERLVNKRLRFKPLISSFFLIFMFLLYISVNCTPATVDGHALFGNLNNNGIQIQSNGNYKMSLTTSPAIPTLNKTINMLVTLTSTVGDKITELPAYISLQKDGKPINSQPTLVMIDDGHFNFRTIFSQPGKYLLIVNVKDLLYTNSLINFIFELDVNVSPIAQFYDLLKSFFINYYYVYIPIFIIILIMFIRSYQKNKAEMKIIFLVLRLYKKLHKP